MIKIHEMKFYKEGMKCKYVPIEMGQLNHYKCKTWEEYQIIRQRGRADIEIYDENKLNDITILSEYDNVFNISLFIIKFPISF